MKLSTRSKGEIAMLKVMLRCAEKGLIVNIPSNNEICYDILIDDNNKFFRSQIKYCGRKHENNLQLNLESVRSKRKYYLSKNVDLLFVYVPSVDKVLIYNAKKFHKKTRIQINLINKNSPHYFGKYIW